MSLRISGKLNLVSTLHEPGKTTIWAACHGNDLYAGEYRLNIGDVGPDGEGSPSSEGMDVQSINIQIEISHMPHLKAGDELVIEGLVIKSTQYSYDSSQDSRDE